MSRFIIPDVGEVVAKVDFCYPSV